MLRSQLVVILSILVMGLAGCGAPAGQAVAPTLNAFPGTPTLVAFPGTPTAQCVREEILPTIEQVQPEDLKPGIAVTVTARGGYFRDDCGGFDESARLYKVYFDDEPVADLSCYVNHCEGTFTLPENIAIGRHCMGVQKGSCQIEVDVTGG